MPLRNYGVLAGRVVDSRSEGGSDSPHFQVQVQGGETAFRVAINVLSQQSPSELLYLADEAFTHPMLDGVLRLPDGFTPLPGQPGSGALDFIRGNLFDRTAMRRMPATAPGPDNDLADALDHFVSRARNDPEARLFAFGERWGPEAGKADKVFGFTPGNGVHDVHMNQGNSAQFRKDDGVWQDGGLLLHFPGAGQTVAVFLAFQSQAWHTDDSTGHALTEVSDGDHRVRIVAALVNGPGPAPERETVTLLNTLAVDLDLDGWALLDSADHRMPLAGTALGAGEAARIRLTAPVQLGNSGGLLTLLDPAGLKVDGVAYTRDQARDDGLTTVF
ncbi:Uncharacterized protein YukJ [Modestobacter sp. DSM 44400]|uniref:DUF2278 family protein n=1 Tax=Modestobacter sp. DSM 44400 TaxID=1550230 RepID=UPI000897D237|nr:DUF2278 family protein [Modestobacter sp. DSM 44400]SDY47616.1 Uncharacterized protein YukJ [Modestobacter sp. DSM 44400]